jgi:predicted MFS family arabinose efflux permease
MQVLVPAQVLVAFTMIVLARMQSSFDMILVALLYAFSFGTILPIVTAVVVDRATDEERGPALSVATASFDLGIGLGAVTLGGVSAALGYSGMFQLTGLAALLGAALLVWDWRATKQSKAKR